MLFQKGEESGGSFALIHSKDEGLYDKIKSSLIGGPSIVTTRYHEVGQTYIRGNTAKPCKSILGYDFNSLYLYVIGQDMPTGYYIRRKKETNFRPDNDLPRYTAMYDWLEWVIHSTGKSIKHKMNYASELRIGPYLIDGYDPESRDLWEYFGCFFTDTIVYNGEIKKNKKTGTTKRLND